MTNLKNISPEELALIAALIGIVLAEELTIEEQNVLGNFIVEIGCVLLVTASQGEFLKTVQAAGKKNETDTEGEIKEIKTQLNDLKKQLDMLVDHTNTPISTKKENK
jgi:hypothetical protein